jgi:hypothetical protein
VVKCARKNFKSFAALRLGPNSATNGGIEIKNNIFDGSGNADVLVMNNNKLVGSNNIFVNDKVIIYKGASYKGSNDRSGNPGFINLNNNNYHLTGSSPAINKGITLSGIPMVDLDQKQINNARDIGAYEYGSSSSGLNQPKAMSNEENESKLEFSLEQNYPNPFNPSTVISFSVPEDGFVTIKIYDVLGNEVKTLVNEQKSAGRYSTLFDASNLSSGIYLYQLMINDFVSLKKMLLLK